MDAFNPLSATSLGLSEQACNECRRRKAKCDRTLPECNLCAKHRRHCLYEAYSRTPLTRKHLTEVEERLRRAEARARDAERRAASLLAEIRSLHSPKTALEEPAPLSSLRPEVSNGNNPFNLNEGSLITTAVPHTASSAHINPYRDFKEDHSLEQPPTSTDDFSWDEQSPAFSPAQGEAVAAGAHSEELTDGRVADGMASLSVEDNAGGYLGGSSGAAMLRLLLPDAEIQRRKRLRRRVGSTQTTKDPDSGPEGWIPTPLYGKLNLARIDLDSAIDAYFSTFHMCYPIVHEPSFRAQYSHVIPRPAGSAWNALAYMIAAIGAWTVTSGADATDLELFMAAKSNLSVDSLETGNITLVQVLTLMSNYVQKRNKPNSGYNYLGLALHMAMGLGLHKGFKNWNLPLLALETRRRVWFCLFVFYTGAAITFGRPVIWPHREAPLPLNVPDRDLTAATRRMPSEVDFATPYSGVAMQSRFHLATNDIYARVIKNPHISAGELVHLDDTHIGTWIRDLPAWYTEGAQLPPRYQFSHAINMWRYRNFRIIMYRPFVIQRALSRGKTATQQPSDDEQRAYERCLEEAGATITSCHQFWSTNVRNRMSAWYVLYFVFQASLIPCVCLRNAPSAPQSDAWRAQIRATLEIATSMSMLNSGAQDCVEVISQLVGRFLNSSENPSPSAPGLDPTHESPQTQISNVYSMLWPNVTADEMDLMMGDDAWQDFVNTDPQPGSVDLLEGRSIDTRQE